MKKTITILMLFVVTTLTYAQKLTDLNLDSVLFWFEDGLRRETNHEIICGVSKNGILNFFGSSSKYNVLFELSSEYWFGDLWYFKNVGYSVYYYRDIKIYATDKNNKKTYFDKFEFYNFYEKLNSVTKYKMSERAMDSVEFSKSIRKSHYYPPSYFAQKKSQQHVQYDYFSILEYRFRKGYYLFYEPKINSFMYGWCDKKK